MGRTNLWVMGQDMSPKMRARREAIAKAVGDYFLGDFFRKQYPKFSRHSPVSMPGFAGVLQAYWEATADDSSLTPDDYDAVAKWLWDECLRSSPPEWFMNDLSPAVQARALAIIQARDSAELDRWYASIVLPRGHLKDEYVEWFGKYRQAMDPILTRLSEADREIVLETFRLIWTVRQAMVLATPLVSLWENDVDSDDLVLLDESDERATQTSSERGGLRLVKS